MGFLVEVEVAEDFDFEPDDFSGEGLADSSFAAEFGFDGIDFGPAFLATVGFAPVAAAGFEEDLEADGVFARDCLEFGDFAGASLVAARFLPTGDWDAVLLAPGAAFVGLADLEVAAALEAVAAFAPTLGDSDLPAEFLAVAGVATDFFLDCLEMAFTKSSLDNPSATIPRRLAMAASSAFD